MSAKNAKKEVKKGSDMGVTPDDSVQEFYDKVIDGSVGTSATELLKIIGGLKADRNTAKLIGLCVMSSMNVKMSVDLTRTAGAVVLPNTLMTGDTPNMTILALIGHVAMMVEDSQMTALGIRKKEKYRQSIGGAKDITLFTSFRDGVSKRTEILQSYKVRVASYEVKKFHKLIRPLAPLLFNVSAGGAALGYIAMPFRGAYWLTSLPFRFVWSILTFVTGFLMIPIIVLVILEILNYFSSTDFIVKAIFLMMDTTRTASTEVSVLETATIPVIFIFSSIWAGLMNVLYVGRELASKRKSAAAVGPEIFESLVGRKDTFFDIVLPEIMEVSKKGREDAGDLAKAGIEMAKDGAGWMSRFAEGVVDEGLLYVTAEAEGFVETEEV